MKVWIVWWWAAWLMAAATLIQWGIQPIIYEKNKKLWVKVAISWWWRCNVTTSIYKKSELSQKYIRWWDFVQYAISQFGPRQIMRRFEQHGVPLKTESDHRVFPVSDIGQDIVDVFERMISDRRWVLQTLTRHWSWFVMDDEYVDDVILATGGTAYRHTGSTWDGYTFAQQYGHTVTDLWPSLCSFQTSDTRLHACSGISFDGTCIRKTHKASWPILITHFGFTWPAVYIISAHCAFESISISQPATMTLIPHTRTYDQRYDYLTQAAHTAPHKKLSTILSTQLASRLVQAIMTEYKISDMQISLCTKQIKQHCADLLWNGISLIVTQRKAGDEFVTAWGIRTSQVDPYTMQSLLCPGLYFAWEILDIDWVTWWYNLTSSRATGRCAGMAILKKYMLIW